MTRTTFLLFDLDGTLLQLGWMTPDVISPRHKLKEFVARRQVTPARGMFIHALHQLKSEHPEVVGLLDDMELAAAKAAVSYAQVNEVLTALRAYPQAIVTSNGRICAQAALHHTAIGTATISATVTRDDVTALKPDPQPLQLAMNQLASIYGSPSQVVMIGDAATDIEAAKALGALFPNVRVESVALLGGLHAEDELRAAHPTVVLRAIAQLPEFIRSLV